jgi:hypothetical protein
MKVMKPERQDAAVYDSFGLIAKINGFSREDDGMLTILKTS